MPQAKKKGIDWAYLCLFLALPLVAGFIGALFTMDSIPTWYSALSKPFFTPPSWLFGPVWTALYIMMGIAAYLVWEKKAGKGGTKDALCLFGTQLGLNTAWSIAFFGLRSPWAGVAVIALLYVAIAATIRAFWGISRPAGYLMLPYIAWVSFAAILNVSVALLNP